MKLIYCICIIREIRNSHKIWVEKPEIKRPFRKSGNRWKGNIRLYLKEICCEDLDWIHGAA
jgi:hypothetical protein